MLSIKREREKDIISTFIRTLSSKNMSKSASISFPIKLMQYLDHSENSNIMEWDKDGTGFCIKDKKRFADEILPQVLKQTQYSSFTRRMNRWQFTLVNMGHKQATYRHPLFLRGRKDLALQMKPIRQKQYGQGNRSGHRSSTDIRLDMNDNGHDDDNNNNNYGDEKEKRSPRSIPIQKHNNPSSKKISTHKHGTSSTWMETETSNRQKQEHDANTLPPPPPPPAGMTNHPMMERKQSDVSWTNSQGRNLSTTQIHENINTRQMYAFHPSHSHPTPFKFHSHLHSENDKQDTIREDSQQVPVAHSMHRDRMPSFHPYPMPSSRMMNHMMYPPPPTPMNHGRMIPNAPNSHLISNYPHMSISHNDPSHSQPQPHQQQSQHSYTIQQQETSWEVPSSTSHHQDIPVSMSLNPSNSYTDIPNPSESSNNPLLDYHQRLVDYYSQYQSFLLKDSEITSKVMNYLQQHSGKHTDLG